MATTTSQFMIIIWNVVWLWFAQSNSVPY